MKNMDAGTWSADAVRGQFRAGAAAVAPDLLDYAIDGLVPETGASVWFGQGSTGKTQLLLWMAAHLASREGTGPSHWLGSRIRRRGHIVVLSAEDIREHLFLRIGGIARAMKANHPDLDVTDLCDRIHVIPFLSLTEEQFKGMNPCLFRGRRGLWGKSLTLKGVEEFVDSWNSEASDDDKIVGVIMDSAVSMAGFELSNSEATTNLLFRINRVSHRQRVFWAIVGHTPKGAAIKDEDPSIGAADRLRGSAMWSTAPRTVVEVRIAGETENISDVQRAYPDIRRRDIVIAMLAKANSKGADFKPRVLRRLSEGAFEDLTDVHPSVCAAWDPTSSDVINTPDADRLDAVRDLVRLTTNSGSPGATFKRDDLESTFRAHSMQMPALHGMLCDASKVKESNSKTLAYAVRRLIKTGELVSQRTGEIEIVGLGSPTAKAA